MQRKEKVKDSSKCLRVQIYWGGIYSPRAGVLGIAGQPIACFNDFAQANHSADGMMRSRPVVTYWTSGSVVCSGYSGVSQQWMSALTLTPFYTPKALSRRPGKTDDYGDNAASFF